MYPGIHNFSEIGKLNKVLLHRPGKELEALTPATLERLLFDDVPYLKIAQQEHDNFARVLRENGVEVVYYVDEVAKAIADPARQIQLVNDFLNISKIHAKGLRASMTSYLLNMPPKEMVTELIAGIKRSEVATKEATSLMDLVDDDYPFVSDPMPNLYFTRDPGACVGEGINIHRMHTPARKRESLLLKYMYLYNRDFATPENKMWYDLSDSYSIEGGDVLVLSRDIVAVGLSQRTTVSGAENFARNLLQNSGFKKVLAFDIPETRAFMHLDTVFTTHFEKTHITHNCSNNSVVFKFAVVLHMLSTNSHNNITVNHITVAITGKTSVAVAVKGNTKLNIVIFLYKLA